MRILFFFAGALLFSHLLFAGDTIYYELWDISKLESIGGHGVTIHGNPQVVSTDIGDAIKFDGDDQLLVDFNPIMDAKEFTVELVFKPDACYPNSVEPRFVHFQDPNDPDEKRVLMELRVDQNNKCHMDGFINTDIAQLALADASFLHDTEVWQHIAISFKDNVLTTYFNGVEELSGIVNYKNQIINTVGKTSLGSRMNKKKYYAGLMKTLKVTHAALEPKDFIFINGTSTAQNYNTCNITVLKSYPNPATDIATISFELYEASKVTLNIYNTGGQLIKTLASKVLSFGKHKFEWNLNSNNGKRVKSGVYLCCLKANNQKYTIKILVE